MSEVRNAKDHAKIFYCRHMLPGIAGYDVYDKDANTVKSDNLFIDTDVMKKSAPSFAGKPVFVHHKTNVPINDIEDIADGYVIECFYNELDGWLWAKMIITSDEGQQAIARGWSVSNAYIPKTWEGKGQHLSLDYDRKISNYEFTHLAIVPNPRYEQADVYTPEEFKAYNTQKRNELEELHNSKIENREPAMKFFRNKQEEVKAGDILDTDFTEITNDDGSKEVVTVAQLKEVKRLETLNAKTKKNEKMVGDDEEIEVDGETVNMADLKACYTNSKKMKKNSEEEAAKKAAEAEEKKNAEEAEKKKAEEEEKQNEANRLKEITNAHKKNSTVGVKIHTQLDGARLGASRYSFDKK